ncbi:MAG: trigger factor [Hyphomicrobiaceae bacterium]|nr:trigger factor [Hyphomicrobiaceae bacterium]
MQITEVNADGLKRTLKVVVGQDELGQRFDRRLDEIKDRVQIKGFRRGKVPVAHLRKLYGRSLMAEVVDQAVKETSTQALTDRKERPAMQPSIDLPEDKDEIERIIDGQSDLAYSMSFEVLPEIDVTDMSMIKLERLTVDVEQDAIDEAIGELAKRSTAFEAEEGRAATEGDKVKLDFVGKIDGVAFDGGTGEGMEVVIGQGNFIPGFEEGLAGVKAGEDRVVTATFPEAYQVADLAGKEASFDVTVKEVAAPKVPEINDDFARNLGAEDMTKLTELVSARIAQEYAQAARMKMKRELLDALETSHAFDLPPSLVDSEFESIWQQLNQSLERSGKTFADEGKTEDEAREEYRKLAERRVRLGLVIGEIGDKNKIQVSQDELRRALVEEARRYPGQEKFVYEYYEKTPGALAQLRAPIFEDKVVDHVLEQVKPAERKVTKDELFAALEKVTES